MIVWAVSIYSLNFSKYSPLQISLNLCTHKNYVIFFQGQDGHLGGPSPPLPKPKKLCSEDERRSYGFGTT